MPKASAHPAPDPGAVLAKATLRSAAMLGLKRRQLAEVIGSSEATISRLAGRCQPCQARVVARLRLMRAKPTT